MVCSCQVPSRGAGSIARQIELTGDRGGEFVRLAGAQLFECPREAPMAGRRAFGWNGRSDDVCDDVVGERIVEDPAAARLAHDAPFDEFVQRRVDGRHAPAADLDDGVARETRPHERGDLGDCSSLVRTAGELRFDEPAHPRLSRFGNVPRRHGGKLGEQQRVAVRCSIQRGRRRLIAPGRTGQFPHVGAAERGERDEASDALAQRGAPQAPQRVRALRLLFAVRDDEQHADEQRPPEKILDRGDRALACPLQVLEDDDERPRLGERG